MLCPERSLFPPEPQETELHIHSLMAKRQMIQEQMEELIKHRERIDWCLEERGFHMDG